MPSQPFPKSTRIPLAGLLLALALTAAAQPPADSGAQPGPRVMAPQPDRPVVDVFALIERLADELDKEFIVDPRLTAEMLGWSTAGEESDYDTLLALLRLSGFTTIEVGDQIRIVPEANARAEPTRILQQDDNRVSDHAIVTRVIDVSDIELLGDAGQDDAGPREAAPMLVPLLRPMMSMQAGQLGTIQGTNKLIVVDRYDNIRRITAVIDELRK
jgi:general secretion pathway protein D